MRLPPGLSLYRAASTAAGVFASAWLSARVRAGKEDGARLDERFGRASAPRPAGRLVWLHGASVGETRVALLVMESLAAARSDVSFLVTTGTQTAAALFAKAAPARAMHQFAPLDRADCVARFLDHWRPDLAVFAESELWPNTVLGAAARGVRLALVNARLSPRSLRNWARTPDSARALIERFGVICAADQRTADALSAWSAAPITVIGNLKLAAAASPVDAPALHALRLAIADRPVWLAASTHAGEDEIVLAAHAKLRAQAPDALLIIAPRHPERGVAVAALADGAPRRAASQLPRGDHPVYVADTIGEMGLFYSVATTTLVAGSLCAPLKGHNPVEPVQFGSAVLSGPHVESFADIYGALKQADAAMIVRDASELSDAVARLMYDQAARTGLYARAAAIIHAGAPALAATRDQLLCLLSEADHAPA